MTTYNKKIKLKVLENKNLPMLFWKDDAWDIYKLYPSTLRELPVIFSTMLVKYKEIYWDSTWGLMAAEAWKMFRESAKDCRTAPFILKYVCHDGWEQDKDWNESWREVSED